jgi:hypothetical protein
MLRNNLRAGMQYSYKIMFNPKDNRWYAWFYEDITDPRVRRRGDIDG